MWRVFEVKVARLTLGGLHACRKASDTVRWSDGGAAVSRGHSSRSAGGEGPNTSCRPITTHSRDEGVTASRPGMGGRVWEEGDGIAHGPDDVSQTSSAVWSPVRPGRRSTHDAILCAQRHLNAGYTWVVSLDIAKFFDRVNHDVLMSLVARRVDDKRVLLLIRRYLQAGVMEGGLVSPRTAGTPQGGPLSPLLSNILLHELDYELTRRGHRYVRYADDVTLFVRSERAGRGVLKSVARYLQRRLKLQLNPEKSRVVRPQRLNFLGYSFHRHHGWRRKVSQESVKRLKGKLKALFRRGRGRNVRRFIADELVPLLRGWGAYFKLSEVKQAFVLLDEWLRRRISCIFWRQWKRPRTRRKRMITLGLSEERASKSAYNGRGPWWNAGASHMHAAIPVRMLSSLGLPSLQAQHRRIAGAM